ncbi:MAG: signal peptidase I [Spirochaetae bacterium HGW-Spirochaetae-3]|jgi:signal peptidase I|nr:MAG: signal peptidase I [Spirochaetae bacterium HGW-Spirochaetae-3]
MMKRVQSFEDTRKRRSRIFRLLKYVGLLFIAFEVFSVFGLKSWVVGSSSMLPTLAPKDRIIVASSAYGLNNPITGSRAAFKAPERGDVVLLRLPSSRLSPWQDRFFDSLIRFLTLQMTGSTRRGAPEGMPVVKRVVACPGDSVMLDGFVVYVKASGTSHYLTEYETSGGDYAINGGRPVDDWDASMPLSGTMAPVELGADEFFVVGDDRFSSADSRFFGPVKGGHIIGKVILRYWPVDRISGL